MTEEAWLKADNPWALWHHLADLDLLSERKKRLFCVAASRRVSSLLSDKRSLRMVEACEAYADGLIDQERLIELSVEASAAARELEETGAAGEQRLAARGVTWLGPDDTKLGRAASYSYEVFGFRALVTAGLVEPTGLHRDAIALWEHPVFLSGQSVEMRAQADLGRELFGNPFHPVAFDPEWRTSTVVALAEQMYGSRDFAPMPVLADALQDAGCDNEDILAHCRDPEGVHVRGCWVVDLVLGKS